MGIRFRVVGAFASSVALLGCGDQKKPSGASSAPQRQIASVPLADVTPAQSAIALGATPLAVDEVGVPRLVRGTDGVALPAATPAESAIRHVSRLASAWGARSATVPQLEPIGDVEVLGGTITRLRQIVDGLPVDGGELRVMTSSDGKLVAASGILRSTAAPRVAPAWKFDQAGAIARALGAKYKTAFDAARLVFGRRTADGSSVFSGRSGNLDVSLARARRVWHATSRSPNATLVAAWVVEAYANNQPAQTSGDAFRMVIAADDGRVLAERNLVSDAAFSYRVFADSTGEMHPFDGPIVDSTPHPTGQPNGVYPAYVPPALITVNGLNHPGSAPADPWLASGRTETWGNNVEAYADFNAPDGLTFGDFRATTTAAGTFDRTYDFNLPPLSSQGQQMAGITSLFFVVNWMHDFWYDGGFTEAAGNAQNANYGRGGEDRDAINAEAQDNALGGSRNNANMSTPDDGLPPRMQVFVWGGKETRSLTAGALTPATGTAAFGPTNFHVQADVVLANDAVAPGSDGCTALPSVAGKIVLVDRGSCTFKTKALMVQNAGGVGVILANNAAGTPPGLGDDATITTPITIPTLSITQADGTQLKANLVAGPVTATLDRQVGVDLEGTLDASVLAHEFGHYVHHRLSLCGTPACGAMSEGWGDFSSLLVVSRANDNFATGVFPMAIYSTQSFTSDPAYYGIRRAPYSADHTVNDLSFRHMTDGVATPTTHPFLVIGNNAEVHNAGEVWASMLWDGYVALQEAGTSFEDVRLKMRKYVVAGLLLAPPDATPTETRDAILTAARAASPADHDLLAAAYAGRGFGSCAVSAPRDSSNFMGIVESSVVKGNAALGAATMALATNCDADEILDAGETAHVTIPVANTGPAALTNVVATLTTTTAGVTVTSAPVTIGTIGAYGNAMATFDISVADSVVDPTAADFTLTLASNDGCVDSVEQQLAVVVNTDDMPTSSATDSFDAVSTVWTTTSMDSAWSHTRPTALDGVWRGVNLGTNSDSSMTSPPLTADATTPVTITFEHTFSFEFSQNTYWDGGVIEISTDGGTTWVDIATLVTPSPYNASLTTTADNPLGGRAAFARTNASYPNPDTVTLDFGTQLAGQTFRIRFRIGSDSNTGAPGWDIDNIAFTGIVGTPFPTLVADAGMCGGAAPDAGTPAGPDAGITPPDAGGNPDTGDGDEGGCCQSQRSPAGSGVLSLGVLALMARRRRRR